MHNRHRATLALVVVALALPAAAHAQLGGLIKKKVADKVAEKVADKAAPADTSAARAGGRAGRADRGRAAAAAAGADAGIAGEITADTLDRLLGALDALVVGRAESDSIGRLADAATQAHVDFQRAHAAEKEAYQAREEASGRCQRNYFGRLADQRGKEIDRRMKADPTWAQKAAARMQAQMAKMHAAQQSGDTTAMLEAQSAMMSAALGSEVSLAKDSAEAVQRCGAVPPRPAFTATEDSLAARATELADRRREVELEAQARVAERSGMTATRFAMARERLERWYVVSAKGGPRFWGEAEGALLERNRDRIARVLTALGVRA